LRQIHERDRVADLKDKHQVRDRSCNCWFLVDPTHSSHSTSIDGYQNDLPSAEYQYQAQFNRAADVFLHPRDGSHSLGRLSTVMSNGRSITIDLAPMPAETIQLAGRAAVSYIASGHAAEPGIGYQVEGRVVVDRETLAFLSIEAMPKVARQGG
jgi:hypothetical protein